jgi:hypothetical protein
MINSSGKSGRIVFTFGRSKSIALFNEGEVVACLHKGKKGKEAFFTLLAEEYGRFLYTKGLKGKEKQLQPLGGFMGLVMEGLQRSDEEGAAPDGDED